MIILSVCLTTALVVSGCVLTVLCGRWWGILIVLVPILLAVTLIYGASSLNKENPTNYITEVYDSNSGKYQTIRFGEFEQTGNYVVIPSHYTGNLVTDFSYKFIDEPVTIKVEDGQEFKYTVIREPKYKQTIVENCED